MVDDWGRHFVYPTSGGKWGFIDKRGEFVIKPIYDRVSPFSEGMALVSVGKEFGYIDKSGQTVLKSPSEGYGNFSDGLASYSIIDKNYKSTETRYIDLGGIKTGYIDLAGKTVIPARFDCAGEFSGGLAPVRMSEKDKFGYIDKSGATAIKPNSTGRPAFPRVWPWSAWDARLGSSIPRARSSFRRVMIWPLISPRA